MDDKPTKSGFIPEPVEEKDWTFGASGLDTEAKVADGNWIPFLPANEKQRQGFESMACTNFSSTTAIEILFTRLIDLKLISVENLKWLNDNGYIDDTGHINFSDRFDALVSNTDPNSGNTLKAVAEGKRKFGMIPEKMLPWVDNIKEYFDKTKITPDMYALGQEFLKRFPINYELVYTKDFALALRISPLAGACFAWNGTQNGVYYKVPYNINHAICIVEPPDIWQIMDSYEPFIKKLANDYTFYDYAIRYIVREITGLPNQSVKKNMYTLRRDPQNPNEVYAFNETKSVKRHIANKQTLIEGARPTDQYWVWSETLPIVVASQEEFNNAVEAAEILLLPPDSRSSEVSTGGFNLWKWIKSLFGR